MLKGNRHDLGVVKEMVMFGNVRKFVKMDTGLCLREAALLKD